MKYLITISFLLFSLFTAFSQSESKPVWWQMESDGQYLEVISYLLYKVQSDSTRNKHADYLHIARNYGYLNDYEKAIFYWKKSYDITDKNDKEFSLYYFGTLAFFERDKESLEKCYKELEKNHSEYYKINYLILQSLYENFEKGYREASNWRK